MLFEWFSVSGKHLLSAGYYLKMACKLAFVSWWWGNIWITISWVRWRLLFRCFWAWQGFMRKYNESFWHGHNVVCKKHHRNTTSQFTKPPLPLSRINSSQSVCLSIKNDVCQTLLHWIHMNVMKVMFMATFWFYLGHFPHAVGLHVHGPVARPKYWIKPHFIKIELVLPFFNEKIQLIEHRGEF